MEWRELRPVLDDAIARLPSKYRIPFVLCYLQGNTVREIAQQLNQPHGTVASRLARARARLRARLVRSGITLSAAGLATVLAHGKATACVPRSLLSRTIDAARLVAAGQAIATSLSKHTTSFMDGGLRMMTITNTRMAAGLLVAAALGVLAIGYQSWVAGQSSERTTVVAQSSPFATAAQADTHNEPKQLASDAPTPNQGELRGISLLALRRAPIDVYRLAQETRWVW